MIDTFEGHARRELNVSALLQARGALYPNAIQAGSVPATEVSNRELLAAAGNLAMTARQRSVFDLEIGATAASDHRALCREHVNPARFDAGEESHRRAASRGDGAGRVMTRPFETAAVSSSGTETGTPLSLFTAVRS